MPVLNWILMEWMKLICLLMLVFMACGVVSGIAFMLFWTVKSLRSFTVEASAYILFLQWAREQKGKKFWWAR